MFLKRRQAGNRSCVSGISAIHGGQMPERPRVGGHGRRTDRAGRISADRRCHSQKGHAVRPVHDAPTEFAERPGARTALAKWPASTRSQAFASATAMLPTEALYARVGRQCRSEGDSEAEAGRKPPLRFRHSRHPWRSDAGAAASRWPWMAYRPERDESRRVGDAVRDVVATPSPPPACPPRPCAYAG